MTRSTAPVTAILAVGLLAVTSAMTDLKTAVDVAQRLDLCSRSRPDFNDCMAARLEQLLPDLAENGISEMGVPRSEPFVIPEMTIRYRNGDLRADLRVRDSKTWGAQGLRILKVKSVVNDDQHFNFVVDFATPRAFTEGYYKVNAQVVVPYDSKGYYNITMNDITGTWNVTGEHYKKDGRDYVRITNFSMVPEIGDLQLMATNIVSRNPELSQYVAGVINQNWRFIYELMRNDFDSAWNPLISELMNKVFSRIPFDIMFPQ